VLDYGLDDRWFESRQKLGIFLFPTLSRPSLGSTHPPIQLIPGDLSLGVKRLGRGDIPPLPQYDFMSWCSVESTGTTLPSLHLLPFFTYSVIQRRCFNCRGNRASNGRRGRAPFQGIISEFARNDGASSPDSEMRKGYTILIAKP
jgi:hypothetical protein